MTTAQPMASITIAVGDVNPGQGVRDEKDQQGPEIERHFTSGDHGRT